MTEITTLAAASAALEQGQISAVELVQDRLALCARAEPEVHSFVTLDANGALAAARRADALRAEGKSTPLTGIPFGIKDIIDVAGLRGSGHSRLYADRIAQRDAFSVALLRGAGAVILGKTATNEFAIGLHDDDTALARNPRNPWHRAHSPGGSSSGSATAVAAGEVLGALGTDTGGSIRVPAAFNGVAGLKPSRGLVSRMGAMPLSDTMDNVGPMGRNVHDLALILDAIALPDPEDSSQLTRPVAPYAAASATCPAGLTYMRIRKYDHLLGDGQLAAQDAAEEALRAAGLRPVDVALPDLDALDAVGTVMATCESWNYHRARMADSPALYGRDARLKLHIGALISGDDDLLAARLRDILSKGLNDVFAQVDVILTHPALGAAPPCNPKPKPSFATWAHAGFNMQVNASGNPALTLRAAMQDGLPLGAQLWGALGRDDLLLAIGRAMERHLAATGLPEVNWPTF